MKTNCVAYSSYFKKYIICVKYCSDDHWYFKFVGGPDTVMRAQSKYSLFDWRKL